jgi:hypothetical protein
MQLATKRAVNCSDSDRAWCSPDVTTGVLDRRERAEADLESTSYPREPLVAAAAAVGGHRPEHRPEIEHPSATSMMLSSRKSRATKRSAASQERGTTGAS